MSWKNRKRIRQKAPLPISSVKPTRRISDTVLMRVLDGHHLESLSDLAELHQLLARQLGMSSSRYGELIRVQTSLNIREHALDLAAAIARWQKECRIRKIDSRTAMMVVSDGASISHMMRELRMNRECVENHLRGSLTIFSLQKKRCSMLEVVASLNAIDACCKPR